MNRIEIYHKSVNVLYDAYFDGTLEHGDCGACATGNLCGGWDEWGDLFMTTYAGQKISQRPWPSRIIKEAEKRSGYKISELRIIEEAFESADKGNSDEDYMYNGLAAVLDVLKQIHEVTDEDLLTTTKQRFTSHHQSKLIVQ